MVYSVKCIFPRNRYLVKLEFETVISDKVDIQISDEESILLSNPQGISHLTPTALGELIGVSYERTLLCLHETDLRNIQLFDFHVFEKADCDLGEKLENGFILAQLEIKYIGVCAGVDVGYGLFCTVSPIVAGTFIGEYVGILCSTRRYVSSTSPASRYSVSYPSCDGGFEIDASEFGNIIRFVNHSSSPNAEFRSILMEGLVHVCCVSFVESSTQFQPNVCLKIST